MNIVDIAALVALVGVIVIMTCLVGVWMKEVRGRFWD